MPVSNKKSIRPEFTYNIVYSRRRTISIIVNPEKGVYVRAPYRTRVADIDRFIQEKSRWIIKTLKGFNSLKGLDNKEGYSDGDSILLFGLEHKLKLFPSEKYSIRLGDNNTIETGYALNSDPLIIRALLEDWFKFIAQKRLTERFHEMLSKYRSYGFSPSEFTVRTMKKRWGSCSSTGKIAISYDLIRLDEIYSDYVIIHELCHLNQHNHGSGYYKLLSEVFPEWKRVRSELGKYIR